MLRTWLSVTVLVLGMVLVPGAAAQAPTLSGESFHQDIPTITSATCTDTELGGTFKASGTATGPYPGNFQESGSAVTLIEGSHGVSDDLRISFTIDSPVGRVTGTKHSTNFATESSSICNEGPNAPVFGFNTTPGVFVSTDTYDANIVTTSGAFTDTGLFQAHLYPSFLGGFTELFQSALAAPSLISKDQCKNGGWRNFGATFKNQGACVSFVTTGGKKPPTGT
jgi:hypothetical protein